MVTLRRRALGIVGIPGACGSAAVELPQVTAPAFPSNIELFGRQVIPRVRKLMKE
jgi:hypothetical protein